MNGDKLKVAVERATEKSHRRVGMMVGKMTVKIPMKPQEIRAGDGDPSVVWGRYVQEQVKLAMDEFGTVPSEVSVRMEEWE